MERLGVLLVLASTLYTVSSQTVESSGSTTVNIGDQDVKLECKVSDLDPYSQELTFTKVGVRGPEDDTPLSSHLSLDPKVDASHYDIKAKPVNRNLVIYTLTITEIKKSDGGEYRCDVKVGENSLSSSSEKLIVPLPISSLVLKVGTYEVSADDEPPKESFELEKFDKDLIIQCIVRGSNPEPQVKLSIGGEDITSQVLRQDQPRFKGQGKSTYTTYDTDLDSTGKKTFDESILGKEITCEGSTDDPAATKTATITLTVKEPPKVECKNVTARLGDRQVKLTCVIESLQRPEKISWSVESDENTMSIQTSDKITNEEYSATQKDVGANKIETTLKIYKLEEKHFDNLYTLQAEVAPKGINRVVRLLKKPQTGESNNDAAIVPVTTTSLMSALFAGALLRRWI